MTTKRSTRIHRSRADREALSSYVELASSADRRRIDRAQVAAFEQLTPAQLDVLVADLIDGTETAATPPRRSLLTRLTGGEAGFATALLAGLALAGVLTVGSVGAVALATSGADMSAQATHSAVDTSFDPFSDTPGSALDF
ncbi:hypothetical protein [Leifsonia sp. NPDC080035]|uniref:DUF3040 domain-containing protein n=1 Tax=Leifsonia sp. NPDC080035 TaxID=3143936 RepID=A0AAU7G6U3_9MICO